MARKPKETTCSDCKKSIIIPYTTYINNRRHNKPIRCKECHSKYMSMVSKEKWKNKTEDEKMKSLEGKNKYWRNLSEEEKKKIYDKRAIAIKNGWNNKSDEEMNKVKKFHKQRWAGMNRDEYDSIQEKKSKAAVEYWDNLSEEEKKSKSDYLAFINKEWRSNLSEEDKREISTRCKQRWDNMSDSDKEKESIRLSKIAEEYRINMTEQDKLLISKKKSASAIKHWNDLPYKIKDKKINMLIGKKINNFNAQFENAYNQSKECNSYYLKNEYLVRNNNVTHCWDYAVFEDDKLCMLIDLDGAYFHADICDYDGLHSKEGYDEKRGLSIPDGVKWCIIYENNLKRSFEYMCSLLNLSYEEFINKRFNEYRSMPFPYPEYRDVKLLKSYHDLCKLNCDDKYHKSLNVNTRIGDRIIQHFHRSLYDNIIDTWRSDSMLRDMIRNHYLIHSYLNKNKILQGFNIYEPAQCVYMLSAGKAKMIMHRYLNEYDEVFDPCYNYGGIMLACISMNKRYVGICNDDIQHRECNNILSFLRGNGIQYKVSFNDTRNEYQCLIAELNDDTQLDEYLSTYKCNRYLFIVNNIERYVDKIVDEFDNKKVIII